MPTDRSRRADANGTARPPGEGRAVPALVHAAVVEGELLEELEELGGVFAPMFGQLWAVVDPEEPDPEDPDPEELEPDELEPDEVEPDEVEPDDDVVVGSLVDVDPVDPVVVEDAAALDDVVAAAEDVPVDPVVDDVVEFVVDVPEFPVDPVEADPLEEGLVEAVAALAATAPPSTRPAASAPIPMTLRTLRCMSCSLR